MVAGVLAARGPHGCSGSPGTPLRQGLAHAGVAAGRHTSQLRSASRHPHSQEAPPSPAEDPLPASPLCCVSVRPASVLSVREPGAGSHAVSLRRGGQGRKTPAPEGTEQLITATLLCGSTRRRFARVESPNHGVWRFISPSGLSTWSLVARLRGRWPESCRPRCAERRADSVCCPLRSPARRPCGSRALLLSPDLSTEPGTGQGSVSE